MPRPTICLNSVMEPTGRSSTMSRQVWASTPVESSREVVTRTGYFASGSMKLPSCAWPSRVAAGDAHDVAVVFVAEVLVFVDQGLPHAGGMLLIDAEDDGLLEAVAAFLQELGDFLATSLVRSSMTSVRSKSLVL